MALSKTQTLWLTGILSPMCALSCPAPFLRHPQVQYHSSKEEECPICLNPPCCPCVLVDRMRLSDYFPGEFHLAAMSSAILASLAFTRRGPAHNSSAAPAARPRLRLAPFAKCRYKSASF